MSLVLVKVCEGRRDELVCLQCCVGSLPVLLAPELSPLLWRDMGAAARHGGLDGGISDGRPERYPGGVRTNLKTDSGDFGHFIDREEGQASLATAKLHLYGVVAPVRLA